LTCGPCPIRHGPRRRTIHDFPLCKRQSRGWRAGACPRALDPGARHDGTDDAAPHADSFIPRRTLSSTFGNFVGSWRPGVTTALVPRQCSKILSTEKARRARRQPASPTLGAARKLRVHRALRVFSVLKPGDFREPQSARPVRRDCADRAVIGPQFPIRAPVWCRPICWMSRS